MRDALSLLDQCAAFHFGETLTYEHVLDVLGAVDNSVFRDLFHAIRENRTKDCILKLEEMVVQGRELSQFVVDFIWFLRNLLLLKTADDAEDLLDMSEDNLAQMREDAALVDENTLMRYIRVFSELPTRSVSQTRNACSSSLHSSSSPSRRWSRTWIPSWSAWKSWSAWWRKGSLRCPQAAMFPRRMPGSLMLR